MKQALTKLNSESIQKRLYKSWQGLYLSFFNFLFYLDVIKRWKGFAWIYLSILSLVLALPFAIKVGCQAYASLEDNVLNAITKIPTIKIINGKAEINKKMPYYIKNKKGEVVILINTLKKADPADMMQYPNLLLEMGQDKLLIRKKNLQIAAASGKLELGETIQVFTFFKYMNETIDIHKMLGEKQMHMQIYTILSCVYPFLASLLFGTLAIFFLVTALMAQLACRTILKTRLRYKQVCRLLTVASTPALALLAIPLFFNVNIHGLGIVLMAIMAAYFSLAVLRYRREMHQLARVF